MKVIVTGANGFIGESVWLLLEKHGLNVIRFCGKKKAGHSDGQKDLSNREFSIDLTKKSSFRVADQLDGISSIVHCAGLAHQEGRIKRDEFFNVNVKALENTLEFAKEQSVEKFILLSSVAVYGIQNKLSANEPVNESTVCQPQGFYAQSKLEGEKKAIEFCLKNDIELTILRLSTIIGEGDPGNLLKLIKFLKSGRFFWVGRGENRKSLLGKSDVGRAVCSVLMQTPVTRIKENPAVYNLASEPVRMHEIVETIEKSLQLRTHSLVISPVFAQWLFRLNRKFLNFKTVEQISDKLDKWLSDEVFSAEKFQNEYGFSVEREALEAIECECQWFLNQVS